MLQVSRAIKDSRDPLDLQDQPDLLVLLAHQGRLDSKEQQDNQVYLDHQDHLVHLAQLEHQGHEETLELQAVKVLQVKLVHLA